MRFMYILKKCRPPIVSIEMLINMSVMGVISRPLSIQFFSMIVRLGAMETIAAKSTRRYT